MTGLEIGLLTVAIILAAELIQGEIDRWTQ